MIEISAQRDIDSPADAVWAVVADYRCDPEWRDGVLTMDPTPVGPVRQGQTTAEVLRIAGRTSRNGGVVTAVGPGRCFTWRTTSGADADGGRSVEELGPERCRVRLDVRVRPHGADRLLAPLLGVLLRRTVVRDLARLAGVVERQAATARSS